VKKKKTKDLVSLAGKHCGKTCRPFCQGYLSSEAPETGKAAPLSVKEKKGWA